MDRTLDRRAGFVVACFIATMASMVGAMLHPETLLLPAGGLFALTVAVLFAPESLVGGF